MPFQLHLRLLPQSLGMIERLGVSHTLKDHYSAN
jgi:hypothetical protein